MDRRAWWHFGARLLLSLYAGWQAILFSFLGAAATVHPEVVGLLLASSIAYLLLGLLGCVVACGLIGQARWGRRLGQVFYALLGLLAVLHGWLDPAADNLATQAQSVLVSLAALAWLHRPRASARF